MPADKKNIFGHPTVAKPAGMPTNARLAEMAELLRNNPQADLQEEVPQQEDVGTALGDLSQLVFLGCIEDSKTVNGFQFDMRTLTGKEQNDVWLSVAFLNNETKFFIIKVAFLARAIISVNGHPLDVLYKGKDFRELTKEQRAMRVVESWQDTLINELYAFYSELVERSKKVINPEDIKK